MTRRICVFGASGGTGALLVRQAMQRGHTVVAFVRGEAAKGTLPPGATVVIGSLLDPGAVERAVAGTDAVISALGPRVSSPEVFCAAATRNIIEAMKAQGVGRLLCITGAMIGDYPHLSWFMRSLRRMFRKHQPALARDRAEQERLVVASGLDWTLIKPPRLTNRRARGRVRSGGSLRIGAFSNISRADLSGFILDQIDLADSVGQSLVVEG